MKSVGQPEYQRVFTHETISAMSFYHTAVMSWNVTECWGPTAFGMSSCCLSSLSVSRTVVHHQLLPHTSAANIVSWFIYALLRLTLVRLAVDVLKMVHRCPGYTVSTVFGRNMCMVIINVWTEGHFLLCTFL